MDHRGCFGRSATDGSASKGLLRPRLLRPIGTAAEIHVGSRRATAGRARTCQLPPRLSPRNRRLFTLHRSGRHRRLFPPRPRPRSRRCGAPPPPPRPRPPPPRPPPQRQRLRPQRQRLEAAPAWMPHGLLQRPGWRRPLRGWRRRLRQTARKAKAKAKTAMARRGMRKNVSGRNSTAKGSSLRAPWIPRCVASARRTSLANTAPSRRAATVAMEGLTTAA